MALTKVDLAMTTGAASIGANTFTGLQTLHYTGIAFPTTTITDVIDSDTMTGASAANLSTSGATKAYVDAAINALSSVPTGVVAWYTENPTSAPTGWLECTGAAVSRTTYADLFAVTSTVFGAGDGSTTFNLPDLRGEFIRGFDDGRGKDSGRAFGSQQGNANLAHTHTVLYYAGSSESASGMYGTSPYFSSGSAQVTTQTVPAAGGAESRPENVALIALIKY